MSVFDFVGAVSPGRSMCKLDYEMKLTLDMGYWVPILADEAIPGDIWSISDEIVVRFQPMVAPPLHQIDCMIHYWAVPYRLLDPNWIATITRGEDGRTVGIIPSIVPTDPATQCVPGTLWDYIGYPVAPESPFVSSGATARYPAAWPVRAYNMIYNEYLRDQNWDDPVELDDLTLKTKCWKKDYFTTALPWPYRGDALAMPMSVQGSAHWAADIAVNGGVGMVDNGSFKNWRGSRGSNATSVTLTDGENSGSATNVLAESRAIITDDVLNDNELVFDSISTFDFNDLRLLAQTQKWLERNARAGVRYGEFVYSHFGVSMGDDRLQRPEYIGGSISPVIVSEVLQTSASASGSTSQGNLAGHGIVVDQTKPIRYRVPEHCVIIGLMCVAPVPAYQSGLQKQWDRRTTFDYPFPEFANLGEQPVMTSELYCAGAAEDDEIFGYQGRYNELRYKPNRIAGEFRSTLDYWHLGRQFEDSPVNGSEFVHMDPAELKRIFAVHTGSHGLLATIGHRIRALRPIPMVANPGLIDH